MSTIKLLTVIHAPASLCFDLARSIDLHKISVAGSREEAISGTTSGLIKLGEQVTWRGTHLGIRQTLSSEITRFSHPYHFRDEMVSGAFKKIIHDHFFEEKNGITSMTDHFEFESPLGILGKIFNYLFLESYMRRLLLQRNAVIKEYAESSKWKLILNNHGTN